MIDIVADLSGVPDLDDAAVRLLVGRWSHPEALGAMARAALVLVRPGVLGSSGVAAIDGWRVEEATLPIVRASRAFVEAGHQGLPLLFFHGTLDARCEAIGLLRHQLARDPMFGAATPRLTCADRCCIARLCRPGGQGGWVSRGILAELPDEQIVGDFTGPCVLIAPAVLADFGPLDHRFDSTTVAVTHYLASARRCGFRTLQCNRAVIGRDDLSCAEAIPLEAVSQLSRRDEELLQQSVPDLSRTWDESRAGSWERFERLYATRVGTNGNTRAPVLVDVRNVIGLHNGTAQAALGILRAFRVHRPDWQIEILASQDGAAFHDIESIAADWPVHTRVPDRTFAAGLRLSQPWHIREMLDLHGAALFNAYLVLDTIAWDVGYVAPPHLEGTWQFMADHADALLFDSEFTRARFLKRFPTAPGLPLVVTHFSFDPKEYASQTESPGEDQDYILVIGNSLDHKDVPQTVETLATAFPFRRIYALGASVPATRFITPLLSGKLTDSDVHRLYARASVVVFPSFYEGFGFPVITALAYGRTVLARRSPLVEEMAMNTTAPGILAVYDRRDEIVETIGRLSDGEGVRTRPLGTGLDGRPPRTWRDTAAQIVEFMTPLIGHRSGQRWIAREHIARQLLAYRS